MNQLQGLPAFGCAQSQSVGALPTKNEQSSPLQKLATGGYVRCQYCCGLCVWCPNYCACCAANTYVDNSNTPRLDLTTVQGISQDELANNVGLNQNVIDTLTKQNAANPDNASITAAQLANAQNQNQEISVKDPAAYAAGLSLNKNSSCIFKQIATPVLDIAAAATGQAWAIPLINGGMTIVNGGSPLDALKAAGTAYLGGQVGGLVGDTLNGAGVTNPIAQNAILNAGTQLATTGKIDPTQLATSAAVNYGTGAALNAADVNDPTVNAALKNAITQAVTTGNINPLSLAAATGMAAANQYANTNNNPTETSTGNMAGFYTAPDKNTGVGTGSTNQSPIDAALPVTGLAGGVDGTQFLNTTNGSLPTSSTSASNDPLAGTGLTTDANGNLVFSNPSLTAAGPGTLYAAANTGNNTATDAGGDAALAAKAKAGQTIDLGTVGNLDDSNNDSNGGDGTNITETTDESTGITTAVNNDTGQVVQYDQNGQVIGPASGFGGNDLGALGVPTSTVNNNDESNDNSNVNSKQTNASPIDATKSADTNTTTDANGVMTTQLANGNYQYSYPDGSWVITDSNGSPLYDSNSTTGGRDFSTDGVDTSSNNGGLESVNVTDQKDQTPTYENVDVVGQRPSDTISTIQPTPDIQPVSPGLPTINDLPSDFLDNIDTSDPLQTVEVVGDKSTDNTIQPTEPTAGDITPVKLDVNTGDTSSSSSGKTSSGSSSASSSGSSSGAAPSIAQPTQPAFGKAESVLKSYMPNTQFKKEAALKQLYDSLDPELKAAMGSSESTKESAPEESYKDFVAPADFEKEVPLMPTSKHGGLIHMSEAGSVSDAVDDLVSANAPTMQSFFNNVQSAFQPTPMRAPASTGLESSTKYIQQIKPHQLQQLYNSINPALRSHLMGGGPVVGVGGMAEGGLPARYHPEAPHGHHPEFITGQTGYYAVGRGTGQSDDIPAMLHDGDYVIDADSVAQLGDGSSKAGAQALEHFRNQIPHHAHGGPASPVPAKIADGEYVLPAAFVTALGGGDNKTGSKLLDKMREELREHKRSAPVNKIPPKAKSPLDYLRMANHG